MTRTGELHVTKECSAYKGQANEYCTITESNIDEIGAGSRVVYAEAAAAGSLDSPIVIEAGPGNTANGHVTLDLATGTGRLTFSGGTGTLAGFTGSADVSADAAGLWHWEGTYSLSAEAQPVSS
jgi:hypothetical protein